MEKPGEKENLPVLLRPDKAKEQNVSNILKVRPVSRAEVKDQPSSRPTNVSSNPSVNRERNVRPQPSPSHNLVKKPVNILVTNNNRNNAVNKNNVNEKDKNVVKPGLARPGSLENLEV